MTSRSTADQAGRPFRTRRGSAEVQQAISDAVLAELAEVGFGRLTFESVADRAGTGKGPLYRRWPDTTSLVVDILEELRADPSTYKRTGRLRDDLIGITHHMTRTLRGEKADAFRSLLGEAHRYPQLLARFRTEILEPMFEALTDVLHDAAARGDVNPDRLTPVVLEVLHALIIERTLLGTRNLTKKDIAEMVDGVLIPLVCHPRPVSA